LVKARKIRLVEYFENTKSIKRQVIFGGGGWSKPARFLAEHRNLLKSAFGRWWFG